MNARNGEGDGDFSQEDIDWMDANCIFIEVTDKLVTFHANSM